MEKKTLRPCWYAGRSVSPTVSPTQMCTCSDPGSGGGRAEPPARQTGVLADLRVGNTVVFFFSRTFFLRKCLRCLLHASAQPPTHQPRSGRRLGPAASARSSTRSSSGADCRLAWRGAGQADPRAVLVTACCTDTASLRASRQPPLPCLLRNTHRSVAPSRKTGPWPSMRRVFFRRFYDKSTRSQCNEGSGGAELTHALPQAGGKGR